MGELRPCPFCGSHATLIDEADGFFTIVCDDADNCGVAMDSFEDKEDIITAWNKRV